MSELVMILGCITLFVMLVVGVLGERPKQPAKYAYFIRYFPSSSRVLCDHYQVLYRVPVEFADEFYRAMRSLNKVVFRRCSDKETIVVHDSGEPATFGMGVRRYKNFDIIRN